MSMKEHGFLLYVPPEIYNGLIKLQADKTLGRSYAGLFALTEGLFRLGYLSQESYDKYILRYSEKLESKEIPKLCEVPHCTEKAVYQAYNKITKKDCQLCEIHYPWFKSNLTEVQKIGMQI